MSADHRIALISDLHGNRIALSQVLRSIEVRGVDQVVCLGDVATLGAEPVEVVDMLQDLGCGCIMGNHDDYMLDPELTDSHNETPLIRDAVDWCRDALRRDQLEFIRRFVEGVDVPLGHGHTLKLFHGSPSSNLVDLLAETPAEVFDRKLGSERALVMAGGHTHLQMVRQHEGTLVLNPGSVGAPFRQVPGPGTAPDILDHAEYAIVEARGAEVSVALQRVPLDRQELARAALQSNNPMAEALAAPYL